MGVVMTRQRLWQLKQKALGLCGQCSKPGVGGLCQACRDKKRLYLLRYGRMRHGKPVDAPLAKGMGRPRLYA